MKGLAILLLVIFVGCVSTELSTISDFKNSFNKVSINSVTGKFQVNSYDEFGNVVYDFISEYRNSISYISPDNYISDTIVINNIKYPLDRNNCLFHDTVYSHLNLNVLDAMSIYEMSDSMFSYLVFESVFAGATGKGINIKLFVVFFIQDNKIKNKIVLSSWFGDSGNFIKSDSQKIEFLKFEPIINESSDRSTVYEVRFIDIITLKDSSLKYKVIETYNAENNKNDYVFERVENIK